MKPLPNASTSPLCLLPNAFTILQHDRLLVPYGRYPHGRFLQIFDRPAADEMVQNLANARAEMPDFQIPIYIGHPDDPETGKDYPDKKAYGWITNLLPGTAALELHAKWSAPGDELLANAHYKWFSPFWGCRELPGLPKERGLQPVRPALLISLGLTNSPNIRAIGALVNQSDSSTTPTQKGPMNKKLLALLGLSADPADDAATEAAAQKALDHAERVAAALANEKTARAAAETALANEKAAAATARTTADAALAAEKLALANERKARIALILDAAIAAGKISLAQKPQWAADFQSDLAAAETKLANTTPSLPTDPALKLGARQTGSNAATKFLALVNERMQKTGDSYLDAWHACQTEHAALFAQMKGPAQK